MRQTQFDTEVNNYNNYNLLPKKRRGNARVSADSIEMTSAKNNQVCTCTCTCI